MRTVKLVPLLLLVSILALSGCNTLVTRRDQYSPAKGSGYWTKKYQKFHAQSGIFDISHPRYKNEYRTGPQTGIFGISHPPYTTEHPNF